MGSLELEFIKAQQPSHGLIQTIRALGEGRGKQELFKKQAPQALETLRQVAVIQSTESSNRIEGITAPLTRIRQLVQQKTTPKDRPEQEIAGYRDVLNTIHHNHEAITVSTGIVLQLHRDLYQFVPGEGGRWKSTDNLITETRQDGSQVIRFRPVAAHLTPSAMEDLHRDLNLLWGSSEVDRLLVIASYVSEFLCVHPFRDGNGRMARLLALLLLYKDGYEVGRYISLEKTVENTRESYYEALKKSSQGWHEGRHSLLPWWEYFLGVVLYGAYQEFEQRIGMVATHRGAKQKMVLDTVEGLGNRFKYGDVERACPNVSRPTINRALAELRREGKIRCIKHGRDAIWQKT